MELKRVDKGARKIIRARGGTVPRLTKEEKGTGTNLWIDKNGMYWSSQQDHPQGENFSFGLFRQPGNKKFEMMDAATEIFGA